MRASTPRAKPCRSVRFSVTLARTLMSPMPEASPKAVKMRRSPTESSVIRKKWVSGMVVPRRRIVASEVTTMSAVTYGTATDTSKLLVTP